MALTFFTWRASTRHSWANEIIQEPPQSADDTYVVNTSGDDDGSLFFPAAVLTLLTCDRPGGLQQLSDGI